MSSIAQWGASRAGSPSSAATAISCSTSSKISCAYSIIKLSTETNNKCFYSYIPSLGWEMAASGAPLRSISIPCSANNNNTFTWPGPRAVAGYRNADPSRYCPTVAITCDQPLPNSSIVSSPHSSDRMSSERVEHQLKKGDAAQQTLGWPRFIKRGNISTETLSIIYQKCFQSVQGVTYYSNFCEFQRSGCYARFYEQIQNSASECGGGSDVTYASTNWTPYHPILSDDFLESIIPKSLHFVHPPLSCYAISLA
jgi:hypothetical protein